MKIASRSVVLRGEVRPATVVIEASRIVAIEPYRQASDIEDLGELALLPGFVDAHVHLNDPGRADWEGFVHGTQAAAAGGITTLLDMPLNSSPVTTTVAALEAKIDAAAGQLAVDVGFWGGVVPGNCDQLRPLAEAGCRGFKAFLCDSGLAEFPAADTATLEAAMREIAPTGRPLLAHCELPVEAPPAGDDLPSWLASRPPAMEVAAIERLLELEGSSDCWIHVVHVASEEAATLIHEAQIAGRPITAETCPHYLATSIDELPESDARWKCAPPIRDREHREALWRALVEGSLDLVASDHSPCPGAAKQCAFGEAWGGISGLQLGPTVTWSEAQGRGFDLAWLARVWSWQSARLAGLADKGAIAIGASADLVAFDPTERWTPNTADLRHRDPTTCPWLGRELIGRVHRTWLRGKLIAVGSEVFGLHGRTTLDPLEDD